MMNPYIKSAYKPKTPKAMMPFPWEEKEQKVITKRQCKITSLQADKLNAIFNELKTKNNG